MEVSGEKFNTVIAAISNHELLTFGNGVQQANLASQGAD
jgi:hypothetical protein